MADPSCSSCRHAVEPTDPVSVDLEGARECHRHAPGPSTTPTSAPCQRGHVLACWPLVRPLDRCGDYEKAPGSP